MREVTSEAGRREFADLIARVRLNGERVMVTRFGRPAAMIVPVSDGAQLARADAAPPRRKP